ncbi:hypothetical protein [Burkholderia phage FLC9]|nr:hypothetical protein [Burkholderia phage FLC9]
MAAPTVGQTVNFYPKRGGQLADLNAIQAITPLSARVVTVGPTLKLTLYVTPAAGGRPYTIKNVPYFDSEFATRPYTNLIPGDGGYCVDPNDAPAFPPAKTVPYQPAGWNMPLSPTHPPANPDDSAQPYVPVKIMANETGTPTTATETPVASDPE